MDLIRSDDQILIMATVLFTFIGAYGKDYNETIKGKEEKIKLGRILFAMITMSTLMLAAEPFFALFNQFAYYFICIVAGWASYSTLPKFLDITGDKLMKYINNKISSMLKTKDSEFAQLKKEIDENQAELIQMLKDKKKADTDKLSSCIDCDHDKLKKEIDETQEQIDKIDKPPK